MPSQTADRATTLALFVISLLALSIIAGCSSKGTSPRAVSELIKTIYQSDCTCLYAYTGDDDRPMLLYSAPEDWELVSFNYSLDRFVNYMVLEHYDQEEQKRQVSLVRVHPDGWTTELYGFTSCTDCEGAYGFWDLHLSPDGRYLAIDAYYYEGSGVALFDLAAQQMVSFERQFGFEYEKFVAWHPSQNAFFASARYALIEYDIDAKTADVLGSPNLRDYVSESDLLSQGYLGSRVDYIELVGTQWFEYLDWHPNGWHFAFTRGDSLYLFNMADSSVALLYGATYECQTYSYHVEWAENPDDGVDPPYFGDGDIIVVLDSSLVSSIVPLNDNISYRIAPRFPLSYFECLWGDDEYGTQYLFRGEFSAEKCHIAEMDHLFGAFVFDVSPEFWFLLTDSAFGHSITDSAVAARYREMAASYALAVETFKEYHYPPTLVDKQAKYNELVMQDSRFESATAEYLATRDSATFVDTLKSLLTDVPLVFMDTIATWLEEFQAGNRPRIAYIHQLLHNRYFNYYGRVLVDDLDQAMREKMIEPYYGELYLAARGNGEKQATAEYLSRKIYEW
jgi:hypothetical protein